MLNLLDFFIYPFTFVTFNLNISGRNNGGKGGLDVGDPLHIFPDDKYGNALRHGTAGGGGWYEPPDRLISPEELAEQDEVRKADLRRQINTAFGIDNPDAKAQLDSESKTVEDSTRAYYTDQLNRAFPKAERTNRFALARQGLLGGSADAESTGELTTDRNLGATRIDEAVRKAVAGLTSQREEQRLQGINLVNAGVGQSAVESAAAGLKGAFTNANNQSRTDLFGDLFSTAADSASASNASTQNQALLARYQQQLKTYFPSGSSGGGRVTPSS